MESLKTKIITSFLLVITILFVFNVFFFISHFAMIKRYKDISNNMLSEYKLIELTGDLARACDTRAADAKQTEKINEYRAIRAEISLIFSRLNQTIINEKSQIAYLDLKKIINDLISDCDEGLSVLADEPGLAAADYFYVAQKQAILAQETATNLILHELEYVEELQKKINHTQLWLNLIGGAFWLLVIITCVIYSFRFSKKIIEPLVSLTDLAKKVESGDLSATVDQKLLHIFQGRGDLLQGNDEISSLANSFNTMLFSLRTNIEKLKEYNEKLIKARKQVASGELEISQLKELDRMKNEIMNIATHELKTPLVSIMGLSEVMMKTAKNLNPEQEKYLGVIHEESSKLAGLIKEMLKSIKNEHGKVEITKEKFNLSQTIAGLKTSLDALAKRSASRVTIEIMAKNIILESDQKKISEVIYNFVDNAVKYGSEKQNIRVILSQPDSKTAKVEVINEGPGISKERQKKLFLKFSQLEPSLSRSQDGMGLGLYICKQTIDSLGGQIGLISEPGHGANFYFTLPLA